MADEYNAAWYNEDEEKSSEKQFENNAFLPSDTITLLASVAGNELRFSPLASGEGVVVSTEEGELELRYNTTVADTSLLAGLRMEVFSWWQGEHGLTVVSSVEDLGIIDTQDFDFRPNGVEVG